MAPEQVAGKPVDYRTDIYSVGLVLYEMFTGTPAFKAENSVAVALKQMSEEVVPPHVVEPTIPVSIERTILKCLEKEPERRYLSIAELETALAAPQPQRTVNPAAPAPVAPQKAQATATARHAAPVARPAIPAASQRTNSSPVLWVLVGVGLTFAVLGGLRAGAIQKAANQIVFNEKFKAPVPPEFAYEIPKAVPPQAEATSAAEPAGEPAAPSPVQPKSAAEPKSAAPKAVAAASKAPAAPDVVPHMETGPARNHPDGPVSASAKASKIAPVESVPNEYVWAGRFSSQSKARDKQKKVEEMLFPSKVIQRRLLGHDYWVLWVGPVKVSRGPLTVEALEAKGFSGAREVPLSEYEKAVK